MAGLFYDGIGNEIGAEMALMEANKLNVASAAVAQRMQQQEAATQASKHDTDTKDHEDTGATYTAEPSVRGTGEKTFFY